MFIPLICFFVGLGVMGRSKPITRVQKIFCLGPRSGIVYQVEDFREIGTVVVRDPQKQAVAQFIRAGVREPGKPGLVYQHGMGNPTLLAAIRADFGVEPQKLSAVGDRQSAGGSQQSAPSNQRSEKEKTS
jgi:hypothetical protein